MSCNCRKGSADPDISEYVKKNKRLGWKPSRKGFGDMSFELLGGKSLIEIDLLPRNYFVTLTFNRSMTSAFYDDIEESNLNKILKIEHGKEIQFSGEVNLKRLFNILIYVSALVNRLTS